MFLERKFLTRTEQAERQGGGDLARLPAPLPDILHNLGRLLATERHIGHLLPDYGFSQSGQWSREGVIEHYTTELRQNLARYERRLEVVEIEADVDDDDRPYLLVEARVSGVAGVVTLWIDLARRSVRAVQVA